MTSEKTSWNATLFCMCLVLGVLVGCGDDDGSSEDGGMDAQSSVDSAADRSVSDADVVCTTNGDCPETDYCAADQCSGMGTCELRPVACDEVYAPVCGCDGQTYSNSCAAAGIGVRVVHQGPCADPDAGVSDSGASDAGQSDAGQMSCDTNGDCADSEYCEGRGCNTPGVCLPRAKVCLPVAFPVCGCDGMTYDTDCERRKAGVRLAHVRACADADGGVPECKVEPQANCCFDDSDCGKGSHCYQADCDAEKNGVCEPPPDRGRCWDDQDCLFGACKGAVICPCGVPCFRPDRPGYCV